MSGFWNMSELEDYDFKDGDFSPLKRNKWKYTHHPVLAAIELRKSRHFRHLSTEKLCELINQHSSIRSQPQSYRVWEVGDPQRAAVIRAINWRERNECALCETFERVGEFGGLSCYWCDGFVWKAPENVDGSWYDDRFVGNEHQYKNATGANYYGYRDLFYVPGLRYTDPLCARCHATAATAYQDSFYRTGHAGAEVAALRGLLALLKEEIVKKFGKPKETNKRRTVKHGR